MARKKVGTFLSLADKQGPLKREEVICPICWSVLMEPVSLPCNHNLCLDCFKKHVQETSLQCPCCRMRLSVWSRRAFRENNLVDSKLWDRIQKEFPKLVQTRICGQDSQDLLPEDLISIHDRNGTPSEQKAVSVEESSPKRFVRDGDFCSATGDIRRELESTLKKHQEDIENQHRNEESASVDLIRQLQEQGELAIVVDKSVTDLDLQLAKKLEEDERNARLAEITARRKLFTEPSSCSRRMSSAGTKLISEWTQSQDLDCSASASQSTISNSKIVECNGITTPKSSGKRPSLSSLSSRSLKKTKSMKSSKLTKKSTSQKSISQRHASPNSQNSILSYLSNSQSSMNSDESHCSQSLLSSPQPSTSAAAIKKFQGCHHQEAKKVDEHPPDVFRSAFSPTKAFQTNTTNRLIPGGSVYKSAPRIVNRFLKFSQGQNKPSNKAVDSSFERDTPTPNSIDLEVNSHFRPIKSAPKTPPKKLSNGTYLPEHLIVKTTPVKSLPHADFEYAIRSDLNLNSSIIGGIAKPNKIASEDGKRVSDDSGRASISSGGSDSVVEILSDSDSGFVAKSARVVRIEQLINEAVIKPGQNQNNLEVETLEKLPSKMTPNKQTKVSADNEVDGDQDGKSSPAHPKIPLFGDYSPSSASDLQRQNQKDADPAVDLDFSLSWFSEDDDSLTPSQDSRQLNFAEMNAQEAEFEKIRLRVLQEVEDRRFAQKLQRDMNQGIQRDKRYGLRSWLKKATETSTTDSPNNN